MYQIALDPRASGPWDAAPCDVPHRHTAVVQGCQPPASGTRFWRSCGQNRTWSVHHFARFCFTTPRELPHTRQIEHHEMVLCRSGKQDRLLLSSQRLRPANAFGTKDFVGLHGHTPGWPLSTIWVAIQKSNTWKCLKISENHGKLWNIWLGYDDIEWDWHGYCLLLPNFLATARVFVCWNRLQNPKRRLTQTQICTTTELPRCNWASSCDTVSPHTQAKQHAVRPKQHVFHCKKYALSNSIMLSAATLNRFRQ